MRTVVLGLDAFDPGFFERLYNRGQMPNLAEYVQTRRYNRLRVANPPQSEVSWMSIASGQDPGQHGIFDFVHRDPEAYGLYVSLLPTAQRLGGTQFVRPSEARTIFDQAAARGFPATSLWWPATFPARATSPVRSLPGLGTPDLQGRLGVGALYAADTAGESQVGKTPLIALESLGGGRYAQQLAGPLRKTRSGEHQLGLPFQVEARDDMALLKVGKYSIELQCGVWSPILELNFKVGPFFSIGALARAILTRPQPDLRLYFLPLQLHPLKPLWRYGTPGDFVKDVWKNNGPFLTLGWPQDTTGLEDGVLGEAQFLALCDSIFEARARLFLNQLDRFQEGILASVFDTLDRVQHMFWRDQPEVIEKWYLRLDDLVGRVRERLAAHSTRHDRLVIVSDHGFAAFDYKVHLNRWLIQHGYLAPGKAGAQGEWQDIDWGRTRAYAIGLNSIYLNLAGREAQGLVQPGERERLLAELKDELASLAGPGGRLALRNVWENETVFSGSLAATGPDLVVGYSPGFRASAQTGLGGWEKEIFEANRDHWQGDHCIDVQSVPGVVFCSSQLENFPNPSYHDIPILAIDESPRPNDDHRPPRKVSGGYGTPEDEQVLQERLKSLGYL